MVNLRFLILALALVASVACAGQNRRKNRNATTAATTKVVTTGKPQTITLPTTAAPRFNAQGPHRRRQRNQAQANAQQPTQFTNNVASTKKPCLTGQPCKKRNRRNRRKGRNMTQEEVQVETRKAEGFLGMFRQAKEAAKQKVRQWGGQAKEAAKEGLKELWNGTKTAAKEAAKEAWTEAKLAAKEAWKDLREEVKAKAKETVMTFVQSAASDVSTKLCDCGPVLCSCCASIGPFGSGCLNMTVETPYKSKEPSDDGDDYEDVVQEAKITLQVIDRNQDDIVATMTLKEGESEQEPQCFDLMGFNDACLKPSSFLYQDNTVLGCFKLQLVAFNMTAKYCLTKSEDGDAAVSGAPFRLVDVLLA